MIAATVLPVELRLHGIAELPVQYLGIHLSLLLLGLLLRLWLVEQRPGASLAVSTLCLAQLAAVIAVSSFSLGGGDHFVMEGLMPVLAAYGLALAVFMVAVRTGRPRSRLLAGIGLISYAMYLFHGPVNAAVYRFMPLTGQGGDLVTMLVCIGLTLALSWLVYRTVERPMIGIGRSLSAGREAPAAYSIALKRLR